MNRTFIAIALMIALLNISSPVHAQTATYAKPAGTIVFTPPNYGVTAAIWEQGTAVGFGMGLFEQMPTGLYQMIALITTEGYDLVGRVSSYGGVPPYVKAQLPTLNSYIASRYPAIGGTLPPSTDPNAALADGINQFLGAAYTTSTVNGVPVIVAR